MAKDSRSTFPIIDDNGCPVDPTIFPRYPSNMEDYGVDTKRKYDGILMMASSKRVNSVGSVFSVHPSPLHALISMRYVFKLTT